jgi:glycosyltransferase involved in cell wall biosynthesis
MNKKTLTLFRSFLEDDRLSMDNFADNLEVALNKYVGSEFLVNVYQPKMPDWMRWIPGKFNLRMRIARYILYPLKVLKVRGDVSHIVDHGYSHLLYMLKSKVTVVTVHDLIPLLSWMGKIPGMTCPNKPILNIISLKALSRSSFIISDSMNTKNDLIKYVGVPAEKINVHYLGLNEIYKPIAADKIVFLRKTFGFSDDVHVVLISGRTEYKNHKTCLVVIERLQRLCKKPVQLVRLGSETPEWKIQLDNSNLDRPVIILKNLLTERLVELYNSVDCFLFPSWYEGFGWPPLEAMACGTPVVTSNAGSLLEVVGEAAMTANPDDVNLLTKSVSLMLENEECRQEYIDRGFKNIKRFTWEQYVKGIAQSYHQAIK